MGWSRVAVCVSLCAALVAGSAPAFAQHAEDARVMARDRYQAGEAKFRAGDYRGAIAEFRAADLLLPAPMNAYNVALAHERLGELDRAAQAYREYLGRRPDAPNRAAVEARISALEAATRPPAPAPVPGPAPAPDPAPEVARRPYDPLLARRVPDRTGAVAPEAELEGAPQPPPQAQPPQPQPQPYPTPEPQPQKASRPFYKHWAFWVVVGVGAIILIDIAVGNSSTDDGAPTMNPGAVIFRF